MSISIFRFARNLLISKINTRHKVSLSRSCHSAPKCDDINSVKLRSVLDTSLEELSRQRKRKYFLVSWTLQPKNFSLVGQINLIRNYNCYSHRNTYNTKTIHSFDTMANNHNNNSYSTDLKINPVTQPKTIQDLSSLESTEDFMKDVDAVMFDCDGVLWIGMKILPSAPELVKKLRAMGKKVFFMTNNSTKTRDEFLIKFNTLGFEASLDEIVSTSFLAALHLKEQNFNKKAYVIGTPGITKELEAVGIESLPIGPDVVPSNPGNWSYDIVTNMSLDPSVGAVVVGFDHHFSYAKLFKAASYLSDSNCLFIGTNTDENFPSGTNMVIPGTGSIVNSVKTAAGRDPTIMGKPSQVPFEYVSRFHSLVPERVLMVGDRGNTDILFGNNCGLRTLLVGTGVTSLQEVTAWAEQGNEEEKKCVPEFYLPDVGEFYKLIKGL